VRASKSWHCLPPPVQFTIEEHSQTTINWAKWLTIILQDDNSMRWPRFNDSNSRAGVLVAKYGPSHNRSDKVIINGYDVKAALCYSRFKGEGEINVGRVRDRLKGNSHSVFNTNCKYNQEYFLISVQVMYCIHACVIYIYIYIYRETVLQVSMCIWIFNIYIAIAIHMSFNT